MDNKLDDDPRIPRTGWHRFVRQMRTTEEKPAIEGLMLGLAPSVALMAAKVGVLKSSLAQAIQADILVIPEEVMSDE